MKTWKILIVQTRKWCLIKYILIQNSEIIKLKQISFLLIIKQQKRINLIN